LNPLAKADTIEVAKVQVEAVVGIVKTACASLAGVSVEVAADVTVKIAHVVLEIIIVSD
jgi:hypothetical protein